MDDDRAPASNDSSKTSPTLTRQQTDWLKQRMKVTRAMFPNSGISQEAAQAFLMEWGEIMKEIGLEKFDAALTLAIRETDFFPSIAAIRRQTGFTSDAAKQVEAEAGWQLVQKHLRTHWGRPEGVPPYNDYRIEYAVRACGGNRVLADMENKAIPFIKKEFIQAYGNAPLAASMNLLSGAVWLRQLAEPKVEIDLPEITAQVKKGIKVAMTAEDLQDRRELLKRQAAEKQGK